MDNKYYLPREIDAVLQTCYPGDLIPENSNLRLLLHKHVPKDVIINKAGDRTAWLRNIASRYKVKKELVEAARHRWQGYIDALQANFVSMSIDWRMVVGLGGNSVFETDMTLHPLYGLPIIPGSALKGLTRAWVNTEKKEKSQVPGPEGKPILLVERIFGNQREGETQHAGSVIFFDAILMNENFRLALDIMNPHYPRYNQEGKPPSNDQDPVPIPFLTVMSATFLFAIAPRNPLNAEHKADARRRVEVLVGEPGSSVLDEAVFQISTEQYATAHNKVLEIRKNNLSSHAKLLEFAQWLAKSPAYIKALSKLLTEKDNANPSVKFQMRGPQDEQGYYTCTRLVDSNEKAVLKKAESYGLIQELTPTTFSLSFKISSQQFLFLNGGWLELFVENEVAGIKNRENGQPLFQDLGRNRHVHNTTGQGYNKQEANELDVSMVYNAQLFIIECKAGSNVTRPETIFKLDSVANAFGAGFVGKYLISALSKRDIEKKLGNNGQIEKNIFEERLEIRKIRLLTWEDLENLKDIFRTEATEPWYPRI